MGYDMSWAEEPVTDAKAAMRASGYSSEAVQRWSTVQTEEGPYYRLNIWGMSTMRALLHAGGCLKVDLPFPTWPDVPEGAYDEETDEYREPYKSQLAAVRDGDTGGVLPAYKVESNDGWLVTPIECMATAMMWFEGGGKDRAMETMTWTVAGTEDGGFSSVEDVTGWVEEFVTWVAEAAQHGGFRVW